jgi:thiamine kinase-like enzyme
MMRTTAFNFDTALARCVTERLGKRVAELRRAPSDYRSSFAIENVTVVFDDATEMQVVFKNLGKQGLLPEARDCKPEFLHDPMREISVYQSILSTAGLGTGVCYGTIVDAAEDRFWLFLEKAPGVELYQVGDLKVWRQVAEWLARLHGQVNTELDGLLSRCRLLLYDQHFYRCWLERARKFCPQKERIEWVAGRYENVIDRLVALPPAFIHGEFYPSNVIVAESGPALRVCPIDWEMAAIGPGLMDIAALTSGKWSAAERRELELAYWNATSREQSVRDSLEEFLESVEYCRLHLCLQWLGWSPHWLPPREHAQDWLAAAMEIAERLGI